MLRGVLSGAGDDFTKPLRVSGALDALGVTKLLGCGHEGCVYATSRDTVLKVTNGRLGNAEAVAARALMAMRDRHPIVPAIDGVGSFDTLLDEGRQAYWIEREGLNDLQLSDEGEAMYTDDVGRVLGGASSQLVTKFPSFVPMRDRKLLSQQMRGYLWLRSKGVELQDHNNSENWGVRRDGSVALRDFGHIWVHG